MRNLMNNLNCENAVVILTLSKNTIREEAVPGCKLVVTLLTLLTLLTWRTLSTL